MDIYSDNRKIETLPFFILYPIKQGMQALTDWMGDSAIKVKNTFDQPNALTFKQRYSIDERYAESKRVLEKYPDRIPVICERARNSRLRPLHRKKFLVPRDLTIGQFMYVIRKHLVLDAHTALYLYVNGSTLCCGGNNLISSIYEYKKDPDGFLYIVYNSENTFGEGANI